MKKVLLTLAALLLIATPSFALATFNPYTKKITNNELSTATIQNKNIKIIRNKYELKQKASKMANGYEFLITNKTDKPIILKELGSLGAIGRLEIDKKILADFGGKDFIPVYNIIKSIQTNKESSKFARPFPFAYEITPNSTLQITVLSDINEIPIVEFQFLIDNKTQTIIFGKDGCNNQEISNIKEYYISQIDSYNLFHNTGSLGECISKGETHLVNSFLKSGININQKFMGMYPTNYAIINNEPEILKMLLEAGADPNVVYAKTSLLQMAIIKQQTKNVEYLINAGALVDEKALYYANKSKNEDIKNLVLSKSE